MLYYYYEIKHKNKTTINNPSKVRSSKNKYPFLIQTRTTQIVKVYLPLKRKKKALNGYPKTVDVKKNNFLSLFVQIQCETRHKRLETLPHTHKFLAINPYYTLNTNKKLYENRYSDFKIPKFKSNKNHETYREKILIF